MICKLLLVVAAFLAVACAAQAETIIITEPGALAKTEYETVDDADGFVVMRAVGSSEEMVRFQIEEALKGVTGKTLRLTGCLAGRGPPHRGGRGYGPGDPDVGARERPALERSQPRAFRGRRAAGALNSATTGMWSDGCSPLRSSR